MKDAAENFLPVSIALPIVIVALWLAHWLLIGRRRKTLGAEARLPRQMVLLTLTMSAGVLLILLLPMAEETRTQVLKLLGLALTAMVALSSTTFIANAMAGIMLRVVGSFRPGDFIQVEERFGRISERGLFHTEIQTEDRDLITLPNLYLATHPVKVVRSSGTMITTTLSLGYDLPHRRIERLLKAAAEAAELQEPFVQIVDLGDFAVTYKVSGLLQEVKQIITARSNLRRAVLDTLHGDGVEIVSPTFMNQRQVDPTTAIIPRDNGGSSGDVDDTDDRPEERIFDKAEEAESKSALEQRLKNLQHEHDDACKEAGKDSEQAKRLQQRIDATGQELDALNERREAERNQELDGESGASDHADSESSADTRRDQDSVDAASGDRQSKHS